jgi:hypothetical protein
MTTVNKGEQTDRQQTLRGFHFRRNNRNIYLTSSHQFYIMGQPLQLNPGGTQIKSKSDKQQQFAVCVCVCVCVLPSSLLPNYINKVSLPEDSLCSL